MSPDEPSRQPDYRRLYNEQRKLRDHAANMDSCITFLLIELRAVQKRLTKLEQHNDILATRKLKAAYASVDELEQRGDLSSGQVGDTPTGYPPAVTGL